MSSENIKAALKGYILKHRLGMITVSVLWCSTLAKSSIVSQYTFFSDLHRDEQFGQEQFNLNLDKLAMNGIRFTQAYSGIGMCPIPGSLGLECKGHCRIRVNSVRGQDHLLSRMSRWPRCSKGRVHQAGKWGIGLPGTEGAPEKQGFDFSYGYYDQARAHGFFPHYLMKTATGADS